MDYLLTRERVLIKIVLNLCVFAMMSEAAAAARGDTSGARRIRLQPGARTRAKAVRITVSQAIWMCCLGIILSVFSSLQ